METTKLKERELPDSYPVYPGYLYVADGQVVHAFMEDTVGQLKKRYGAKVVTSCDISGRNLWEQAV